MTATKLRRRDRTNDHDANQETRPMAPPNNSDTTMIARFAASVVLFTLCSCGPEMGIGEGWDDDSDSSDVCSRRDIAEHVCAGELCLVRWDDTELWSRAWDPAELSAMPDADASELWPCDPYPDVDVCKVVDGLDHVGCFRLHGDVAVAVAPTCSTSGWLDAGCGMSANAD